MDPDTVVVELVEEVLVWHLVEGLTKVKDGYVDLPPNHKSLLVVVF